MGFVLGPATFEAMLDRNECEYVQYVMKDESMSRENLKHEQRVQAVRKLMSISPGSPIPPSTSPTSMAILHRQPQQVASL